jgi:hypothetical protein
MKPQSSSGTSHKHGGNFMFCRACGSPLDEGNDTCPNCDTPDPADVSNALLNAHQPQTVTASPYLNVYGTYKPQKPEVKDEGFMWGILGWFVPIVGLILFFVWNNTKPKSAKAALIGALIYWLLFGITVVILAIVAVVIGLDVFYAILNSGFGWLLW